MNKLEDVYMLWLQNLQFRTEFKKNPEKALKDAKLELGQEDLEKIKTFVSQNEKLDDRISK
jgi:CRISPR/Cas system-associated endoribonuclease Cas2